MILIYSLFVAYTLFSYNLKDVIVFQSFSDATRHSLIFRAVSYQ